jgi:hypothetical protein
VSLDADAPGMAPTLAERPLLGISPLTGNVYVLMRNGTKRAVPESELVTVIVHWLDHNDLIVTKDGFRVKYGVEEILPL